MTTIAWDGYTLAADRQVIGSFLRQTCKIFSLGDNDYFAGAGELQDITAVGRWLQRSIKTKPTPDADSFVGIIIRKGKCYRIENNLIEMEIKEKHHSVGSGAQFAIAAMYLGQGAVEAVQTASVFDPNTSFTIDSVNVPQT